MTWRRRGFTNLGRILVTTQSALISLFLIFLLLGSVPASTEAATKSPASSEIQSSPNPLGESSAPRNIVIFYDDYPSRGDPNFQVTREIAMPLVAYLDQNGRPVDWMFDSFIFYSMWLYHEQSLEGWRKPPTQAYIDSWISYLFDGHQVVNLDATVAELKVALSRPDYRMKVFLSVPVDSYNVNMPSIRQNINKLLTRWKSLNPLNLRLIGFYWGYTEDLWAIAGDPSKVDDEDRAILRATSDYLHSKSLKLLIKPYSPAWYIEEYQGLGVDYVIMQPNYVGCSKEVPTCRWIPDDPLALFKNVNEAIGAGYVEGAEFEIPVKGSVLIRDWRDNLRTYFQQAYLYGWNKNKANVYYHGADISLMGRKPDPDYRAAYEKIYQFIVSSRP